MQCDGNLVVYASPGHVAIWSSRTGAGGSDLEVQGDGNLVIYQPGHVPVWATGTSGSPGALIMQNDGNLVLYAGTGQALWSSKASYEAAITWFYNHQGATNYEGLCELAIENAFGTSGRYPTAVANWNARDHNFPYTGAPRGTLVFYNTSPSGHVALSIGNGYVISSSAGGHIGVEPVSYFQNPLGWGHSPW
jgi:cell wall-associated NlpC family hydrolase